MSGPKRGSSAVDPQADAAFGGRLLTKSDNVFDHNAWDNVEWTEELLEYAQSQIDAQRESPVAPALKEVCTRQAAQQWDAFYAKNAASFFKDRRWLRIEFPELVDLSWAAPELDKVHVLEIGCGAGNTVFPLLEENPDPRLFVHACDFSATAVQLVQSCAKYDARRMSAFVWDLSSPDTPAQLPPGSVDVVILVFVFSALSPEAWEQAVDNIHKLLKPGGLVLFRDYGRYDLAQVRFKKHRYLDENFYIRGDNTCVYFFTPDQLATIFGRRLVVERNAIDKRLLVNRKRQLKMYRVWLQGRFRKPAA